MSNNSTGDAALFQQMASFVQHQLPGLPPGRYKIAVQQHLTDSQSNDITLSASGVPGLPSISKTFGITASRFSIDPNTIQSVFPPPNGDGEFSLALPHVVLENESLPWSYSPYGPKDDPWSNPETQICHYQNGSNPIDYDNDKASWLAVLLLGPADVAGVNPLQLIRTGTVKDLVPGSFKLNDPVAGQVSGGLPDYTYSQFCYLLEDQYSGSAGSVIDLGVGKKPSDPIRYIDIPYAQFDILCPGIDELALMAHVRKVRMNNKPIAAGQTVDQEQSYSVVMGNRLPDGASVALLVSLEAMEFALRGHPAGSYYDTAITADPKKNGVVRLSVLYSWTFTSRADSSFEFEAILKALNTDTTPGNSTVAVPDRQLRMADIPVLTGGKDEDAVVQDMFASGYVPMNHLTRVPPSDATGSTVQTVSWYRGPLIPNGAFFATPPIESLVYSADELLRFDPNTGMFDVSYAMAWQLGRLLALQNKDFSVPYYLWRGQQAKQFGVLHDDIVFGKLFAPLLALYKEPVTGLLSHGSTRKQVHNSILLHLATLALGAQNNIP